MYSREIGFSNSRENYTADYLRAKYAAANASPRRTPFKPSEATEPKTDDETPLALAAPSVVDEAAEKPHAEESSKNFIQNLAGDDLLMLSVLALLLFSGGEKKNFDIILAAALLFVEFA